METAILILLYAIGAIIAFFAACGLASVALVAAWYVLLFVLVVIGTFIAMWRELLLLFAAIAVAIPIFVYL